MTTSASTTFSPSSRSTTRSTPCVLGCCGPMLITSSLVSNIAPRTVPGTSSAFPVLLNVRLVARLAELEPVERVFHQQFAGTFERIILPLREALPVVRHQNAPAIGVAGEVHPEHVVHLALQPVRRRPYVGHRRHRLVLADPRLQTHPLPQPRRLKPILHA